MFAFIGWMIIGLIAGALARLFMPGRQPMGIFVTMLLGMVGSLLGGFLWALIFGQDPTDPGFRPSGLIMSTVGAMIALAIYMRTTSQKRI
jgi:uncharacterized membrane protein YeaQ/YmgE (transglycosylase-associated protein family)